MPEPESDYTAIRPRPPSAFAAALEELHIPWLTGELQGVERLLELGAPAEGRACYNRRR
jgi:hypothetical protein